jgi:hypothetical protein
MKRWTDVARPHEDILRGELEMAAFAADLGSVARGSGSVREVYADPVAFFRATYLTTSMRALLNDVLGALAGAGGDRLLQLRTPFGGGKTHTLLALYHLVTSRADLAGFSELDDLPDPGPTRVAVLSGVDLDPSAPRAHEEGVVARTLWGEMAWQVGGADGYRLIATQDERLQAPGGDALVQLFPEDQPVLLLLDEVLVYTERAKAIPIGESSLGAQVLDFLQTLTEFIARHPRAAMVYSLQRSVLEAAGGDADLLYALDHLVTRVDAKREPVSGDEVMRVVQRRLFADLGDDADRRETAREYADIYRRYRVSVAETDDQRRSAEAEADQLAERIEQSYPFHPALLDLMHQRWTTLPTYQRTRGALQFLASVVHAVWHGDEEVLPLLGPGDVSFSDEGVRGSFFAQVGDREGFTGVLERDLTGSTAGVRDIDRRLAGDSHRLAKLHVGTRVASAIMLYSFGGRTDEQKGVLERELVGALLAPDLDRNLLTAALSDLKDELLFLHTGARRYRFDKTPNINHLLTQEGERLEPDEILDHVRRQLERQLTDPQTALLWPKDGSSIPDHEPVFRVAYLHPDWNLQSEADRRQAATELLKRCGTRNRDYRNAIAFAVPSRDSFDHARAAARRALAAGGVARNAASYNLTPEQLSDVRDRQQRDARDIEATLERAYQLVLIPIAKPDAPEGFDFEEVDLSARLGLGRLLHDRIMEALSSHVFDSITPIKLASLLNLGDAEGQRTFVACDEAVTAVFSYLQFPKLRGEAPLRAAITKGSSDGTLGYTASRVGDGEPFTAEPDRVWFRRPVAPDEIDLAPSAYLLSSGLAGLLVHKPEEQTTPEGEPRDQQPPGPPPKDAPPITQGTKRLRIVCTVGKDSLFPLVRTMLTNLADRSDQLRVQMDIDAEAAELFDPAWIRNAVREPLEESGASDAVVTGDE